MEGRNTAGDGADAVFRCSLLVLVLAAATNAVVAVIHVVVWPWWMTGVCVLVAVVLARSGHVRLENTPRGIGSGGRGRSIALAVR